MANKRYSFREAFQCLKVEGIDEVRGFMLRDVKVRFTCRPISAAIFAGAWEITNSNRLNIQGQIVNVRFQGSTYLLLDYESDNEDQAVKQGRESFEVALAFLEVSLGERVAYNKLYEALIDLTENKPIIISEPRLYPAAFTPFVINDNMLEQSIDTWEKFEKMDISRKNKIELALRWYQRGLLESIPNDRYLYFWIPLEILTFEGTTEVDRAVEYIKRNLYPSHAKEYIKDKLEIGKMFGWRCKIVHEGEIVFHARDDKRILKLKQIVQEILKNELRIEKTDPLDKYFV